MGETHSVLLDSPKSWLFMSRWLQFWAEAKTADPAELTSRRSISARAKVANQSVADCVFYPSSLHLKRSDTTKLGMQHDNQETCPEVESGFGSQGGKADNCLWESGSVRTLFATLRTSTPAPGKRTPFVAAPRPFVTPQMSGVSNGCVLQAVASARDARPGG
ncbi:hypothetical protein MKZ38_007058 [Zalerion maritima]|uniref:Uncharacterized protein n=1 Tax=Zalerion maritima TaxID=339359 RepID=A0AAD5RIW1_9PEZI|nr:hypothetical protein MKZ38_007058 [Zalerion maritima]